MGAQISRNKIPQLGFTLIELLVVISVIALLASVVLVALNNSRVKARDAKRLADIQALQKALEIYYDKYGSYISTSHAPTNSASTLTPLVTEGIVGRIPLDPSPIECSWWGTKWYVYGSGGWASPSAQCTATSNNNSYTLEFCLENPNDNAGHYYGVNSAACGRHCYARCIR